MLATCRCSQLGPCVMLLTTRMVRFVCMETRVVQPLLPKWCPHYQHSACCRDSHHPISHSQHSLSTFQTSFFFFFIPLPTVVGVVA
ncbi:uncharacterized protein DS421_6g188700 [Arachis hypogaea]|nr:uncharacterized protein DS421_6g188700 [Arachis hypogaea]